MLKSNHLAGVSKHIQKLSIEVSSDDIFKNPRREVLIWGVFENEWRKNSLLKKVDQLLNKGLSRKAEIISFHGKKGERLTLSDQSFLYKEIMIFGLGQRREFHLSSLGRYAAEAIRAASDRHLTSAAFAVDEAYGASFFQLGQCLNEAYYLSQYRFDRYKSHAERKKTPSIATVTLYLSTKNQLAEFQKGLEFGRAVCAGIFLVRNLVNEPASHVNPEVLSAVAREIAAESHGAITVEVLERDRCQQLGMGAFLGVAQGSDHKPQFIILKYQNARQRKKICVIGKSITFDSGGLSLKPADSMETMKIDMAGGATVLGFFQVLSQLNHKQLADISYDVYGILPACENMPSGKAMRPGDIVTAVNGKTIEVANTDAEGRLVLADALAYAQKYIKPSFIIDFATLTGAIMVSLGEAITGLFSNNERLSKNICKAAEDEGELIWKMPLHEEYLSKLKSTVADIRNVSKDRYGGAITGALFLAQFVDAKVPWAHLDIAGAAYNEGEAQGMVEKGGTGWGVKTLIRFISTHYDDTKRL